MKSQMKRNLFIFLFSLAVFPGLLIGATKTPSDANSNGGEPLTPIHEIQGEGQQSAFVGKSLTTSGIITGLTRNGFFLQTPDKDRDNNDRTAEGIFVFAAPASFPEVKIGYLARVTGTVKEEGTDYGPLSLTELAGTCTIKIFSKEPLPQPVKITSTDAGRKVPLDQLERFEGMRVSVESATVVGPTKGIHLESQGTSQSVGAIFAVLAGVPRPFREPGLEPGLWNSFLNKLTDGKKVVKFDGNPEVFRIETLGQIGCVPLEVTTGVTISNISGILGYTYGMYGVFVNPDCKPVVKGSFKAPPVSDAGKDEFTVASFNMERFYDGVDDQQTKYDVAMTPEGFEMRLSKVALVISQKLRYPDILGVQEMENLATLQSVADRVNQLAKKSGAADPQYKAFLVEGNCPSGIDNGFLVKTSRVKVLGAEQAGGSETMKDPMTAQDIFVNLRPPLILRALVSALPGQQPFPVTVINNHFKSYVKLNDPIRGPFIIQQRKEQAEFLAKLVDSIQKKSPEERIVLIGDFNTPTQSDGLLDVMGIIRGEPLNGGSVVSGADLVKRSLFDLSVLIPAEQKYSFIYNGSAQVLDHVLVSKTLVPYVSNMCFVRNNADFPDSFRNDPKRPERLSDHDIALTYVRFSPFSLKFSDLRKRLAGVREIAKSSKHRYECRAEADLQNLCQFYMDHYIQSGKISELKNDFKKSEFPSDVELSKYLEEKARFGSLQND